MNLHKLYKHEIVLFFFFLHSFIAFVSSKKKKKNSRCGYHYAIGFLPIPNSGTFFKSLSTPEIIQKHKKLV